MREKCKKLTETFLFEKRQIYRHLCGYVERVGTQHAYNRRNF